MEDWVFVDTCVWASFFTKPASPEKRAIDRLIDQDRVALTGPIVGEVLVGFRRQREADWAASRLKLAHFNDATWEDWRNAANMGREFASQGSRLPLSDLVIAAVALRLSASVYSTDPHFDLISGLRRYRP